jgi:hypothetical protein
LNESKREYKDYSLFYILLLFREESIQHFWLYFDDVDVDDDDSSIMELEKERERER